MSAEAAKRIEFPKQVPVYREEKVFLFFATRYSCVQRARGRRRLDYCRTPKASFTKPDRYLASGGKLSKARIRFARGL